MLLNEIKNRVMLVMFYFRTILYQIKVALGLMEVKYGMFGYFSQNGVGFSSVVHTKERLAASSKYDNFNDDDVVVISYPKTGTNFTAGVIESIYRAKRDSDGKAIEIEKMALEMRVPAMMRKNKSVDGPGVMGDLDGTPSPRGIGTHLPWSFLPPKVQEGKVKVVHCIRNPKDVVCSYYPFLNKTKILVPGTSFNDFFSNFLEGNVLYGNYFKFLREWYPNRNNANILNLHYEDLTEDLKGNVERIAEFLGVKLTDEQVNQIVFANTFANKKKEMGKSNAIYRKGVSGGWKSELTVEQSELMDEWIQREMEGMDDLHFKCL